MHIMKKLNKVRGRITHAKQIKSGMTLWRSGHGGVSCQSIVSKPFAKLGIFSGKRELDKLWVHVKSTGGSSCALEMRSLNDMGVHQQGGYKNETNRLFRTKAQADNWQVYLVVSGMRGRVDNENALYFDDFFDDDYFDEGV
jgi:hypothetical protein